MRAKCTSVVGVLLVLSLTSLTASAQVATGLESGVHADPGSPAAKEYALPLNQARQVGGDAGNAKSGSPALFGAGIKSSGPGGSRQAGSDSGGARHGAGPGASGAIPYGSVTPVPAIVLRAARSQSSSNGDGWVLALLGGGAAILVLGVFGGTLMRRGRRSIPSS